MIVLRKFISNKERYFTALSNSSRWCLEKWVVGKNAVQEYLNSLNLLMAFILLALNTLDSLQVGKALQFLLGCL